MEPTSPILTGFLGSLVAGLGTGLGAVPIFVRTRWSKESQRLMLAVAGGMMLGATFFSLLQPALALVRERGGSSGAAVGTVALGVVLGALALWGAHAAIPHEHFSKGREGHSALHLGVLATDVALRTICEAVTKAACARLELEANELQAEYRPALTPEGRAGLEADEGHKFQVRAYAVMWRLDDELNPSERLVDRLVLAYESQDVDVAPPSASEIDDLSRELLARRQAAEAALAARPPSAHPSTESCRYCGVRQLCDAYWAGSSQAVSDDGRFGDVELKITGRHGPTSWDAVVVRARDFPAKTTALLRLQQPDEFKAGARVRVLDGALARDPEDDSAPAIVTLSALSEAYRVE